MRFFIFSIFICLFGATTKAQTVIASFIAPDTVCRNQTISITNTSSSGSTYNWSFCKESPTQGVTGVNLGNPGLQSRASYFDLIFDGTNYIGMVGNDSRNDLVRLNFGNSLLNVPTATTFTGATTLDYSPNGTKIIKDDATGQWFCFVANNSSGFPTPVSSVLLRFDFGTSLLNAPTVVNYGTLSNQVNFMPFDVEIKKDGSNYVGFLCCMNNSQTALIYRLRFGNSLLNTPQVDSLGNFFGATRPNNMRIIYDNNKWYAFIPSDGNADRTKDFIYRLDFGNSLSNTPTAVNLGNPSGTLFRPYDISPYFECDQFRAYVIDALNSNLVKLKFTGDVESTSVTGTNLGNVGTLNFPQSITDVFTIGNDKIAFVVNQNNRTITRLTFNNCNSAGIPPSTAFNPPPFSFDSVGTYNVSLTVNFGQATEKQNCQSIVVVDSIQKPDATAANVCAGDTIKLRVNNIEAGVSYSWTGPAGFTAGTANANVINATAAKAGQYIVTATGRCGTKRDTVNVTVSTVSVNLGRDTAICSGNSITLNATTANATYLWSTNATSPTIFISTAGTYWVRVTANGCVTRDTIIITQTPSPNINLGADISICQGSSITLNATTPNATYLWSNNATTPSISVNTAGTYWVRVTVNGCIDRDTIVITQQTCAIVTASFNAPDTVCINEIINITNTSTNGSTYNWAFCKESPTQGVTGVNIGNPGLQSRASYFDLIFDGTNYIGMVGNDTRNDLVRLNFGNSLLNVPISTTFTGATTLDYSPNGTKIIKDDATGQWFCFVANNSSGFPTPVSSVLLRFNFGSSLLNAPTVTDYGTISNQVNFMPFDIEIKKDGNNYIGFLACMNTAQTALIYRLRFGNSLLNIPQVDSLGNFFGATRPNNMRILNKNNKWYAFIPSDGNADRTKDFIYRLDFGNSLLNTPTAVNLGNPSGTLFRPYDVSPYFECDQFRAYVIDALNSNLVKLRFNGDIESTNVTGTNLGNVGSLNFPQSITDVFTIGNDKIAFVVNQNNRTVTRLTFNNCNNSGVPSSNAFNPPPFSFDSVGTYNVSLTVNFGQATETQNCQTIVVLDTIKKPDATAANVCAGDTIKLRVNNIEAGVSYSWTGPAGFTAGTANANVINATAAKAGQYIVTATGRCGTKRDTVNVTVSTVSVNLGRDTAICSGNSITLNATTANATYLWSTNATSPTISVSTAGTYWVRVTVNGCVGRDTIVISQAPSPVVNLGRDTAICQGNSLTLNATTANATYLWSTNATSPTISVSTAGSYWVRVTVNGCIGRDTIVVTVTQPPAAFSLGNDTTYCGNFSRVLSTGNATTTWSTGQTGSQITVNTAGTYIATITNNCGTRRDTIVISQSAGPAVNIGRDTAICQGNSLTLNATTANATYLWSSNATSPTISVNSPGTYWVRVTVSGCSNSDTIVVTQIQAPPAFSLGNDTTYCGNFSRVLSTGNATTTWSTGQTGSQITVNTAGTYIATITNSCGTRRDTIVISQSPIPVVNLGRDTAICQGNSLTLNATTANATYLWSTNATSPTISVNTAGSYWVRVTVNGCNGRDTIVVTVNQAPASFSLGNDTTYCGNFSRVLSTGNATTTWSTGQTGSQITVNTAGTYIATIINSCGTRRDTIVISQSPIPVVNLGRDTAICQGNNITLDATTANATYLWSTNATSPTININTPGTYWVRVTVNGCSGRDTILINEIQQPASFNLGNDTSYCGPFSRVLSTGNATTTWSTGQTGSQITVNQGGTYIATITNTCGVERDTIIIDQFAFPAIDLGSDSTICSGNSVTLDATTTNATYQWNNNATSSMILVNAAGTYWVRVTVNGCSTTDTIIILTQDPPAAFNLGNDTAFCGNVNMVLSTGNPATQWSTGQTGSQITVTQAGTYGATVSNSCGTVTDSIQIFSSPVPGVVILKDTVICDGQQVELQAVSDSGVSFLWNDQSTANTLLINAPGIYYVTASLNGCNSSDTVYAGECEGDLWIPNAFTPNGDGVNDLFGAYGKQITEYRMLIFDRWGEKIFESNNMNQAWDGTYKNEKVMIDSYVYVIFYKIRLGGEIQEKMKKGTVTVLQ